MKYTVHVCSVGLILPTSVKHSDVVRIGSIFTLQLVENIQYFSFQN